MNETDERLLRFLGVGIAGGAGEQSDAVKARMFDKAADDTPEDSEPAGADPGGLASAAAAEEANEKTEKEKAKEKPAISTPAEKPAEEPESSNDLEALRAQQQKVDDLAAAAVKSEEKPAASGADSTEGYHPEALKVWQQFAHDPANEAYVAKLVMLNESDDPAVRAHGQLYAAALMLNAQKASMRDEFETHTVGTINEQRAAEHVIGSAIDELEKSFPKLASELQSNKYARNLLDNVSVDLARELGYEDAKDFLLKTSRAGKPQNISTFVDEVGKRTMQALRLEAVKPGAAANGGASSGDGSKARQKMPARAATAERGSPRAAGAGGQSTDRKEQARAIKDRLLG